MTKGYKVTWRNLLKTVKTLSDIVGYNVTPKFKPLERAKYTIYMGGNEYEEHEVTILSYEIILSSTTPGDSWIEYKILLNDEMRCIGEHSLSKIEQFKQQ